MKSLKTVAFLAVLAAGCGVPDEAGITQDDTTSGGAPLTFSPAQTAQILNLVNDPATDLQTLQGAGLSETAARSIVSKRDGKDAVYPSTDDTFFDTLAQLDAAPYVTGTVLQKLATYATAHPGLAGETVKGVVLHGWQDEAVVWGVNQATEGELDAQLDDRAAHSLFTHKPFTTVAQMSTLSYVGATAVNGLLGASLGWWNKSHPGGTTGGGTTGPGGRFDGAVFTDAEAVIALQIVNQATLTQLTANGFTSTPAKAIIAARPFSTLAQVAAVSGVGTATMNALLKYAQGGTWGGACLDTFSAAVGPQLPALLFMSESDRPFDLVMFTGAGATAPTAESVLALVGAQAGSTAEVRDVSNYYVGFEPSGMGDGMAAAAAVQAAISAQLTDVVYIAIHPPAGSINQAEVGVYLLGRTRCGDLVGLHAISIET
jgi:DNA uptake protein ComE-like DNA-binding protein